MGSCASDNSADNRETGLKISKQVPQDRESAQAIEAKVVLLGDQSVGKSCIAQRYCKNVFTDAYQVTIGGSYFQQNHTLSNGHSVKFHLWDTGGQERFRTMTSLYYRDAAAAILVYDITNKETFKSLSYWVEELRNKADIKGILLVVAGNKSDMTDQRKVTEKEAKG